MSKALGVQISRRRYLIVSTLLTRPRSSIWGAIEEVANIALAHPDWDMEETKTWEWWHRAPVGQNDVGTAVKALFT